MDKKYDQITTGVCLPHRSINIFPGSVPFFNKSEVRFIVKKPGYFLLADEVFYFKFLDNFVKPDDFIDSHFITCRCDP